MAIKKTTTKKSIRKVKFPDGGKTGSTTSSGKKELTEEEKKKRQQKAENDAVVKANIESEYARVNKHIPTEQLAKTPYGQKKHWAANSQKIDMKTGKPYFKKGGVKKTVKRAITKKK